MAESSYKYSEEYRSRFAFNGSDLYWMEEAFKLFSEKAAEQVDRAEKEGKRLVYTKQFFPMMFKDILSKAEQWADSYPPKPYDDDEE